MILSAGPSLSARGRLPAILIPLAFWAGGLSLAHGPMIASGLGRVQGDLGDPRLQHYMLEHGYRWMARDPVHSRFWDAPIFYPAPNASAYSDTLIGALPLYAIWRIAGVPADIAFPLFILMASSVNFGCAFLLLRSGLGCRRVPSGFGAFLFAFASARIAQLGHPQLLPAFYGVLAVYALIRVLGTESIRPSLPWLTLWAVSLVGQTYSSFYLAWFLWIALGLALFWAVALPSLRPRTLAALKRHGPGIAGAVAVAGLCMIPFLRHSLQASSTLGVREYDEIDLYLPRLQCWIQFGPEHWLYGWLSSARLFDQLPFRSTENALGLGFVTVALSARGIWELRKTPFGSILLAVSLSLLLWTARFPGGASAWSLAYLIVPGAQAARVVTRVSQLLLLPAAIGAAVWLDRSRWQQPVLAVIVVLALLEQGRRTPTYDRREARDSVAAIARRVDPSRAAFYYTSRRVPPNGGFVDSAPTRIHVDAMMASLEAGVPTINGYSGWNAPDWPFAAITIVPDERTSGTLVENALQAWCRRNGLDPARVQWINGDS
ncbi:MAG TPA: hypothetical protein VE981_10115 [Planctomycetota bacterium]|nr:hypothetical protein [Planctomycetota bacterium]